MQPLRARVSFNLLPFSLPVPASRFAVDFSTKIAMTGLVYIRNLGAEIKRQQKAPLQLKNFLVNYIIIFHDELFNDCLMTEGKVYTPPFTTSMVNKSLVYAAGWTAHAVVVAGRPFREAKGGYPYV